jgi:plastocyanin
MTSTRARILSARHLAWFATAIGFAVLTGCSGDDTSNKGSTGAGGSAATSGAAGAGTAGSGNAGGSGGASGGGTMVNGCDSITALDKTASATTTVTFSDLLVYDPACIRIKAGSSVTWSGNFTLHPLEGGTVSGAAKSPDPASPIKLTTVADAGSVTFGFPAAGNFGYYCTVHWGIGMKGAVFVVP